MMPSVANYAELSPDGKSLTIHLPLTLRKRGGRKIIISPPGAQQWTPARPRMDNTLIRALARAFRWKHMLETGEFATVIELAAAERLDRSFVSHVLQLTLLAPDLVEAILDGRQSVGGSAPGARQGVASRMGTATGVDGYFLLTIFSAVALREARPTTGEVMSSHPCGTTGHG